HLAGADVKFRAMPRTRHFVTFDLALGKGSFLVRAEIVERKELAVDIEQDDLFALQHHQVRMARRDLARARRLDEFAHELVLLQVKRCGAGAVPGADPRVTYGLLACRRRARLP